MAPMMKRVFTLSAAVLFTNLCLAASQACASNVTSKLAPPFVAPGYEAAVVVTGLKDPRGIVFDNAGRLLLVDVGIGVKALTLQDDGGTCVYATDSKVVISDRTLNHGLELSEDGNTLWTSNPASVYQYSYDATTSTATGRTRIIRGMFNSHHDSRTILRSRKVPNTLVINRGSAANIDPRASVKSSGHAQVKAFDLTTRGAAPFDFTRDGKLLAWGVRNTVGLGEHPVTGGIWGVENSVDDIARDGVDFHQDNPSEKMNYFGTLLDNTSKNQGSNFGYPQCYSVWNAAEIPEGHGIKVGQQFSINKSVTDAQCQTQRTPPRLPIQAHTAPLDIKFGPKGLTAYVSLTGSHNRPQPKGYSVNLVHFRHGDPVDPSTSKTALTALIAQANKTGCPYHKKCLRPVSIALRNGGKRLFFSSDFSGEVWVLSKTDGTAM